MKYIPLNVKSGYSFFRSSLQIGDLVSYAINKSNEYVCLTDVNSMFGALELVEQCKKNDLKYILGMEINMISGEKVYPLILLIKNEEGYRSICHLTKKVSKDDLDTSINYEELEGNLNGLILIIPSLRGELYSIYKSNKDEVPNYLARMEKLSDELVIGLECYSSSQLDYLEYVRSLGMKMCIANSCNYLNDKDSVMVEVLNAIKNNDVLKYEVAKHNLALDNDDFLGRIFKEEELDLNKKLFDEISFDIYSIKGHLIDYPLNREDVTKTEYLKALCYKGLEKRLNGKVSKQYKDRLDYELSVIDKMGYTNYFLVVYDYVKYAKKNGIYVGPGRGSGAGALTAYCLGITDVDSVKYDLLFERFLNPERVSMPDLDVDFIDNRREDVVKYLFDKYSSDHVSHVVAFQTFKARQAMRDAMKVLSFNAEDIKAISKVLPHFDRRNLKTLYNEDIRLKKLIDERPSYKKAFDIATKLEGLPRTTTHIAGVVLSKEVLSDVVPVYSAGDVYSTQYSKDYIEKVGLLKMDILALTDLAVISDTIRNIKELEGIDINLNSINYDDHKIYELINNKKLAGLFQISSAGMRKTILNVKPTCLNDLVAILALFRPGPMEFIPEYASCKNEHKNADYIDECLKDILQPTYGIIVYQEQIMQVLQRFAGFSLGEADIVRRAISKKNAEAMSSFKEDFVKKSLAKGHSQEVVEKVYELIARFASYGFNKAHTVAYAMISATMGYLKAYYPTAFYCACMDRYNGNSSEVEFQNLISEMKELNIQVLPPRINKSKDHFVAEKSGVRFSLQNIKGISNVSLYSIINEQEKSEFKDFYDFMERVYGNGVDIGQVNNLIDAGYFDEMYPSRNTLRKNLDNILLSLHVNKGLVKEEKIELVKYEDDKNENDEREKAVLGSYFVGYPFDVDREKLTRNGFVTIDVAKKKIGTNKLVVYVRKRKTVKTKNGEQMALLDAIDSTGTIVLVIFPDSYKQYASILYAGKSYYVEGNIRLDKNRDYSCIVNKIVEYIEK